MYVLWIVRLYSIGLLSTVQNFTSSRGLLVYDSVPCLKKCRNRSYNRGTTNIILSLLWLSKLPPSPLLFLLSTERFFTIGQVDLIFFFFFLSNPVIWNFVQVLWCLCFLFLSSFSSISYCFSCCSAYYCNLMLMISI